MNTNPFSADPANISRELADNCTYIGMVSIVFKEMEVQSS